MKVKKKIQEILKGIKNNQPIISTSAGISRLALEVQEEVYSTAKSSVVTNCWNVRALKRSLSLECLCYVLGKMIWLRAVDAQFSKRRMLTIIICFLEFSSTSTCFERLIVKAGWREPNDV